jgi:signal transduction histidine kinase/HD-like signal output (HDOD) protein/CheY-like chemotaxis protein
MAHTQASTPRLEKRILTTIESVKPLSPVLLKVLEQLRTDDADFNSLNKLISSDPSLTTTVLHRVNRASLGLQHEVSSIEQALSFLGINSLRCLVLSFMVRNFLPQPDSPLYQQQQKLWSHCLATAIIARNISELTYPELINESFVGGLLHDLGKVAVAQSLQDDGVAAQAQMPKEIPDLVHEVDVLDTDHSLLGKKLGEKWRLPQQYIHGMWLHHQPVQALGSMDMSSELVSIIKLADLMAHDFLFDRRTPMEATERTGLLNQLALEDVVDQTVLSGVSQEFEAKAAFFNLEGDWRKIQALALEEAKKDLSEMVLELDDANQNLQSSNRVLQIANELALRLSKAHSLPELFSAVTDTYQQRDFFQAGVIYIVDQDSRLLEGSIWSGQNRTRSIMIFLDQDGQPVWDRQTESVPDSLKKVISSYKDRHFRTDEHNGNASLEHIRFHPPLYFVPLFTEGDLFGEFCFLLNRNKPALTRQEEMGLLQCANLIKGSLEKIRLNEKLNRRSEELSQALWQTHQQHLKLLQTERLAAVGQLAAGAAHEINNPLAIINARAQMLLLKEDDPKKENDLKQITEQIDRISTILADMMDFARPAQPELGKVHPAEVLNRVASFMDNSLKKNNISVTIDLEDSLPVIQADPNQLEQVFLNIMLNAKHAIEDGGGTISIRAWPDDQEETVIITFCDDGPGIDPQNLRRIFDPFFTTKEEGKGTGLGLSTSWGIIDKHYGAMDLKSKPGEGTCVTISLPQNLARLKASSTDKPASHDLPGQKHTILAVDDESHIRDILTEMLVSEGFDVKTAENGDEALKRLDRETIDLVLLDIRMPLRNGLNVLQTLTETFPHLPVLIITGQASREEMRQAETMGAIQCIRKPFHIKHLLKEIRSALDIIPQGDDKPVR